MAYYLNQNDYKLAWSMLLNHGRSKSYGRNRKNGNMSINSKGNFTTVDGVAVRKLFVNNLPDHVHERDLQYLFSRFGEIVEVSVVRPPYRKSPYGFVTFFTPEQASNALRNKSRLYIEHKKIYVSLADSWHQPLELADGHIVWDRRKKDGTNMNMNREEQDCEEEDSVEMEVQGAEAEPEDESCAISRLNDDCLLLIFNLIPMHERLPLINVCRRWRTLSMSMWFGVRKLDFTLPPLSNIVLTDARLTMYLSLCPNITSINIATDDHQLTNNAIVTIAKNCKNLEEIAMRDIETMKRSLALLARSCPGLKAFYMDACTNHHDNEMVSLVKYGSNLEHIGLKYSSSPSGLWLRNLRCPLKSLSFEMYDFNPDHLIEGLKKVKDTLTELKFVSCDSVRSNDIEVIAEIVPNLKSLTLAGGFPDFKSNSLMPITRLKNLCRLDLDNNTYVCDQFLKELAEQCVHLEAFSLSGIDDRHLSFHSFGLLTSFSALTHLTLACVRKITDANLKSIAQKNKRLKNLDLMGCIGITDDGCQSIVTKCKELEILDVSGCGHVTNRTVLAAIESTKGTQRKLKIIAGDSGIDMDICLPPAVVVDPSSSIMSHYPGAMFILDPDFELEDNEAVINHLYPDGFVENDEYYNQLIMEEFEDEVYEDDEDSIYDVEDEIWDYAHLDDPCYIKYW